MMKLDLSPEAVNKLQKYYNENKKVLLDLDDGFGRFSGQGDCALLTKFRIIVVANDENLSDYPVELASSLGTVYFKDSARSFLDEKGMSLRVNPKTQLLVFANTKETIDSSVNIIDLTSEA